jgi:hypothetical protein
MSKQILNEEFLRMQKLAGLITEAVEVPTWLKGKLEDVHVKPGQGSIFAKPIDNVLKLAQDTLDKTKDIDKIANSTGTLTVKSPGIGYNLVLPIEQAKKLPGAKETEVEKIEGPNKIKVPAITTTSPLTQFKSDELTIIVRPKKDEAGTVIPNEYIVLSAFPGDPSIPRASEWGKKYAVIIPDSKEEIKEDILETVNKVLSKHRKQLKEDKIGNIDLNLVKSFKNEPEVKKLSQKLQTNKDLLNKALKFVADASSNEINEDEKYDNLLLQKQFTDLVMNEPELSAKSGGFFWKGKNVKSFTSDELKKLISNYKEEKNNKYKEIQDKNKLTPKDKIKSILTSAGLGILLTSAMQIMSAGSMGSLDNPDTWIASLIAGALSGIAMGAAATDGYTRKSAIVSEVDDLDIKDQVLNIIKLGKQVQ